MGGLGGCTCDPWLREWASCPRCQRDDALDLLRRMVAAFEAALAVQAYGDHRVLSAAAKKTSASDERRENIEWIRSDIASLRWMMRGHGLSPLSRVSLSNRLKMQEKELARLLAEEASEAEAEGR